MTAPPPLPPRPSSEPPLPPSADETFVDADTVAGADAAGASGADPVDPHGGTPVPPSFPSIVTSLTHPVPPTVALSPELDVLFNHLATSFIPANQPCNSNSGPHPLLPPGAAHSRALAKENEAEEPVLVLVTPFEGGDAYVAKAVNEVAAHLSADVVRVDLALGVGFDGPNAPLAETGFSAPHIAQAANPLFQTPPAPENDGGANAAQQMEEDDAADDEDPAQPSVIRFPPMPMMAVSTVATPNPFGGMMASRPSSSEPKEEWIAFFTPLINMQLPEGTDGVDAAAKRRIILLESTSAMAETLDVWWPSFMEAVRRRRRGTVSGTGGRLPRPQTTQPTTVVLSVAPSLLLPHTAEWHEPENPDLESGKDRIRSVVEALGASVGAIHVEGGPSGSSRDERLWWSSEEHDHEGRARRDDRRLRAILRDGPSAMLPWGSQSSIGSPAPASPHPVLDMIMGRNKPKGDGGASSMAAPWKTLSVIPATRDLPQEQHERTIRRRAINAALMMRAVGQLGASLPEPLVMLESPGSAPARGRKRRLQRRKEPDPEWSEYVIPWRGAMDVASTAVGRAAVRATTEQHPLVLKWSDIQDARAAHEDSERRLDDTVGAHLSAAAEAAEKTAAANAAGGEPAAVDAAAPVTDPVVEAIKKNKNLGKHEKRLLGCIVDPSKLAGASFNDVHLPFKTVDAIRTVISLPLLFPEAFQGGILKEHVTSGALLFGPPGTGKTLLARAIAAESGARMLAIQPSDVNDMWVGEGEKLVKAVFSLARRMSPCVVFLDEVDSIMGARSSRDSSGGSKAHNQILTEFMQEMDGLSSASANRDKRVVVVGATNRPFDLDDAILRRLPRRLLVDLPGKDDRKAIMRILLRGEALADDVDIDQLAADTEGFSGSDLKHLCVAAALAAVKEVINVPWKAAVAGVNVSGTGAAAGTPSSTDRPGGEEVRLAVDEGGEKEADAERKQPTLEPIDASAAPAEETARVAKMIEDRYLATLEQRAAVEADEAAGKGTGTGDGTPAAGAATEANVSSETVSAATTPTTAIATEAPATPAPASPAALKRTLAAKHFKTALVEIRPSSSEEGTLPELRKWAEQYGEGGKRRGKKSGFGRGFGFAELGDKTKDKEGYGRVDEDM